MPLSHGPVEVVTLQTDLPISQVKGDRATLAVLKQLLFLVAT